MTDDIEVRVKFTKVEAERIRTEEWASVMKKVKAALLEQHPEELELLMDYSARLRDTPYDMDRVILRKTGQDAWMTFMGSVHTWESIHSRYTDIRPLSLKPPEYDEAKVFELLTAASADNGVISRHRLRLAVEAFDDD